MNVDAEFASWLQSLSLKSVAISDQVTGAWGDLAGTREMLSAFALKADADVEAYRQLNLFGVPMAVEVLQVNGLLVDLVCRPVTLTAARAGYEQGTTVFVLAAKEQDNMNRTNLTVLRPLA